MTELQPCKCHTIPYVDKKPNRVYANFGLLRGMVDQWYVKCPCCGKTYGDFQSREAAVKAWNRSKNNEPTD